MDEAAKRVNTVLDEYQKKREDFKLDAAIKIAGGATVGLTFGILTKRLIRIRRSVVAGSFIGLGMAVERYSQQLSAPYVLPPTCDVTPAARFFPDKLEGSKLCTLLGIAAPVEKQEESAGVVETIVEEIKAEANAIAQEVEQAAETVETEAKAEANAVAQEVEQAAETVDSEAKTVEAVAEKIEAVAEKAEAVPVIEPVAEKIVEEAEKVEKIAQEVEAVAEKVEEVAQDVEKE